jgi:hypothetical protein
MASHEGHSRISFCHTRMRFDLCCGVRFRFTVALILPSDRKCGDEGAKRGVDAR